MLNKGRFAEAILFSLLTVFFLFVGANADTLLSTVVSGEIVGKVVDLFVVCIVTIIVWLGVRRGS